MKRNCDEVEKKLEEKWQMNVRRKDVKGGM